MYGDPQDLHVLTHSFPTRRSSDPRTAAAARRLGAVGRPLPPPPEEARPRGRRHSTTRDAEVVGHHYDVGNDFYRLVLGPSMTYSCARFADPAMSLTDAPTSKHDLVCRKLGLQERTGLRPRPEEATSELQSQMPSS